MKRTGKTKHNAVIRSGKNTISNQQLLKNKYVCSEIAARSPWPKRKQISCRDKNKKQRLNTTSRTFKASGCNVQHACTNRHETVCILLEFAALGYCMGYISIKARAQTNCAAITITLIAIVMINRYFKCNQETNKNSSDLKLL